MPELPEVEVLVRRLHPLLKGKVIEGARVFRPKIVAPSSPDQFVKAVRGARIKGVTRRAKFLLFELRPRNPKSAALVIGHLGMTGRMYLLATTAPNPKHTAVVLELGREKLVFEDTRYFGRMTLDQAVLSELGPEPLGEDFTVEAFGRALRRSRQPIKVKLLDQCLVAGLGNIYASEALFVAGISPRRAANKLTGKQVTRLWSAIRETLSGAISWGSTVPLNWNASATGDKLFYFGRMPSQPDYYHERLRVYDRAGQPCMSCGKSIRRLVQTARSTFYCPGCQR